MKKLISRDFTNSLAYSIGQRIPISSFSYKHKRKLVNNPEKRSNRYFYTCVFSNGKMDYYTQNREERSVERKKGRRRNASSWIGLSRKDAKEGFLNANGTVKGLWRLGFLSYRQSPSKSVGELQLGWLGSIDVVWCYCHLVLFISIIVV